MEKDRFYIAITVEEDKKFYAYVVPVTSQEELLSKLTIKGIKHANIYKAKNKATQVVNVWNNGYKHNGTYMFDEIKF